MSKDKIEYGNFDEVLYGVHKYSYKEVEVKLLKVDNSQ